MKKLGNFPNSNVKNLIMGEEAAKLSCGKQTYFPTPDATRLDRLFMTSTVQK